MAEVIVEPAKVGDGFVGRLNHRIVARGNTQGACADNAHEERPQDVIQAARTRNTDYGKRDQIRTIYKGNPNA
jgi:hypothetical protein